jgi:small GTP-binding protein
MVEVEKAVVIQKKICVVGEFGVGKTSLISRYVHSLFSDKYHTTVGVKISKKQCLVDRSQVTLVIWDLAGESPLRTLKPAQVLGAAGFLLVADGTRPNTLDIAIALQRRVTEILGPVPFIFALNKADLAEEWTVNAETTKRLSQRGWDVRLSSAKTGQGVEEMFFDLSRRLVQNGEKPNEAC